VADNNHVVLTSESQRRLAFPPSQDPIGSLAVAGHAKSSGRSAPSVYGGHEHTLRQTVIAMATGHILDEHENPGEATVQVILGRVRLAAGDARSAGRSSPGRHLHTSAATEHLRPAVESQNASAASNRRTTCAHS
jgi:quercetin dioxygenase-like cupin family protein